MTTSTFIKMPKRLRRLREGLLGDHLELFSARLLAEGHCQQSACTTSGWLTTSAVGSRAKASMFRRSTRPWSIATWRFGCDTFILFLSIDSSPCK